MVSNESIRNIGYGTLTGLFMFSIIVIICWFLRERSESSKVREKQIERIENMKIKMHQYKPATPYSE